MELVNEVKSAFERAFNRSAEVVSRAPGRINIIGGHTDYNEGFVLPAAIDMEVVIGVSKNDSGKVNAFALDMYENDAFKIDELKPKEGWINYIMGVTSEMIKKGVDISGFDLVFMGNVPVGAGLSSSAALECALATALNELFKADLTKLEIAKLSQQAEHNYAGVMCGIMDQFASTFGKENHVIRLDCRSMEYEYHTVDLQDYQFLLLDTNVKHSLATSEYNDRKNECQAGVLALQQKHEGVTALRDATIEMLDSVNDDLTPVIYKRCSYIIKENQRVIEACEAMDKGDLKRLGQLLYETHDGLRRDYAVSCDESDFLVDYTKTYEEVLGARMMGGGFGGCTLNLIKIDALAGFVQSVSAAYKNEFNKELTVHAVVLGNGARVSD